MSKAKRNNDAVFAQAGACNPTALANSLVRHAEDFRKLGTNALTRDPAMRLIAHQLASLFNIWEIDNASGLYGRLIEDVNRPVEPLRGVLIASDDRQDRIAMGIEHTDKTTFDVVESDDEQSWRCTEPDQPLAFTKRWIEAGMCSIVIVPDEWEELRDEARRFAQLGNRRPHGSNLSKDLAEATRALIENNWDSFHEEIAKYMVSE